MGIYVRIITTSLCITSMNAKADCWQIENKDMKNFCLAMTGRNTLSCWQILNQDKKFYCLAIVSKDNQRCWQIEEKDLRELCLSLTVKQEKIHDR